LAIVSRPCRKRAEFAKVAVAVALGVQRLSITQIGPQNSETNA
jgi:hypothetical protein